MGKKKTFLLYAILILVSLLTAAADVTADTTSDALGIRLASSMIEHHINPYIAIMLIALIPIVELRGAIPIGILFFHLQWHWVILASIVGNMLPIFFVLFIFRFVEKFLRRFKPFDKLFDWFFAKTLAKSESVEKYQELGLTFFVGIPLPVTGAWTGSLIAYLMHLSYAKSILYIFLGVLSAAVIVSVITYFKWIGLIIAVSVLTIITVIGIIKTKMSSKNVATDKEQQ